MNNTYSSSQSEDRYGSIELQEVHNRDLEKSKGSVVAEVTSFSENGVYEETTDKDKVKRGLKPRHITLISIGGCIGTGLFIGLGAPLGQGPVNALIAYIFVASIAFCVTQSLGEMVTYIPVTSSFTVFSTRFLSPAFGAANGWMYWFSWAITFALELSVVGQIIEYWTFKVPIAAWIAIFWVLLTTFNMFPVKYYGEIEFWIATVKVIAIMGFLIYAFVMVCGASKKQGPIGFRYWRHPGAFGDGIIAKGIGEARFLGWVSCLVNAAFTFQGTELVGVTAGESANPRRAVPKAIKSVFFRILVFYIGSLFFIGLLVPYNDPKLTSSTSYVSSSPFIIAIENMGTKVLPDIFNAVILVTIISAGNSNIYIGSRVLYGLANVKLAPKWFSITTKDGVPYVAVLFTAAFGFLAFMVTSEGAVKVFNWFLNIIAIAGFFAWLLISVSHIRFMQALKHRGISRDELPFKAVLMPYAAYYAAFWIVVIILVQGFTAFAPKFDVSSFFAAYISAILFVIIWAIFQIIYKCRFFCTLDEVDIDTDRREIEALVWDEEPPRHIWDKLWNIIA